MLVLLMHWNKYNIVDRQRAISFQQPINRSDPIRKIKSMFMEHWKLKWKMSKNQQQQQIHNERKEEIINSTENMSLRLSGEINFAVIELIN